MNINSFYCRKYDQKKHSYLRFFGDIRDLDRLKIAMRNVDFVVMLQHLNMFQQQNTIQWNCKNKYLWIRECCSSCDISKSFKSNCSFN